MGNRGTCDDNGDQQYFRDIIGDSRYESLNEILVNVAYNETANAAYIYILGTLPNGTTAAGGKEAPYGAAEDSLPPYYFEFSLVTLE
ncbi:hypothetical protein DL769_003081 [Monosporascus sp. CRB-8-3]|nr:hypothetical protein DL769_003081 [Monosporascus sp. CRB-8-3]